MRKYQAVFPFIFIFILVFISFVPINSLGAPQGVQLVSTESTEKSFRQGIVVDENNNIHIVWNDLTNYGGSGSDLDIFYKRWNASAGSWLSTEVVSTESGSYSEAPKMDIDSLGNIHVIWHDGSNYNSAGTDADIFYKMLNATTWLWTPTEVVSTESTQASLWPALSVDSMNNVHVAWDDVTNYLSSGTDNDIFYKYRNVSTGMWSTAEVISTESTANSRFASIIADKNDAPHLAWHDATDLSSGSDNDIFYKFWNLTLMNWSPVSVVSTESDLNSERVSLAFDNTDNLHFAWHDLTDYNGAGADSDIFFKRLSSQNIWSTTEIISSGSNLMEYVPSIAIDSTNTIHVVWFNGLDRNAPSNIFYRYWDSSTSQWSTIQEIRTTSLKSWRPEIYIDETDNIHMTWSEGNDVDDDFDIYYAMISDNPSTIFGYSTVILISIGGLLIIVLIMLRTRKLRQLSEQKNKN